MTLPPAAPTHRLYLIPALAGVLMALAAMVMLGWVLRVPGLVTLFPGATAMVFSNAACFLLLGLSLLLTAVRRAWCKPVQSFIGILVALTGGLVIMQYIYDLSLPLDLPALHTWLNDNPGRMAPNTALAHLLAGVTVLLATNAGPGMRALPALIGAFAVFLLGLIGLLGYRLRPELLYGWHVETRMALHTGAAFIVAGYGFFIATYRAQNIADLFRRREDLRMGLLGGALMIVIGLTGGLMAFTMLQGQLQSWVRDGLQDEFENRRAHMAAYLPHLIESTEAFAERPRLLREFAKLRLKPEDAGAHASLVALLAQQLRLGATAGIIYDANDFPVVLVGSRPEVQVILPLPNENAGAFLWDGRSVLLRSSHALVQEGINLGRVELDYPLPVITHMLTGAAESNMTGEMLLCVSAGERLRCLPPRLDPRQTDLPATTVHGPALMARALAGQSGLEFDEDYRGVPVLAAYGPVASLGLGLVVKLDAAEIYQPVRKKLEYTLLLVLVTVALGILLLRTRLVPLVTRLARSEQQFRSLFESAPDAMLVTDLTGRIQSSNSRAQALFGYSAEELTGQPVEILIPHSFHATHAGHVSAYAQVPRHRDLHSELELYGRRRDGSEFPAEVSLSPLQTGEGTRVVSTVRDITERKRAMQALRDSEQRWQFALEGARDGVWDWNLRTNEVFFSRQWKRMLGFEEDEIANRLEEWDQRVHPDDKAQTYADIQRHLDGNAPFYQNEHRVLCKDGGYKWILDRGMVVERDAEGKATRIIGTHTDISERKQTEQTIRELSLVDELTGLRNRRGFHLLAELQLHMAQRMARRAMLYYVDLDNMKKINDAHGHGTGDQALRDTAAILRATFRETDTIARLGGDEFVVLALEAADDDGAGSLQRLQQHVAQYNQAPGRVFRLAISAGLAIYEPDSAETLTRLLERADAEMYRVKQRRRDRP